MQNSMSDEGKIKPPSLAQMENDGNTNLSHDVDFQCTVDKNRLTRCIVDEQWLIAIDVWVLNHFEPRYLVNLSHWYTTYIYIYIWVLNHFEPLNIRLVNFEPLILVFYILNRYYTTKLSS